MLGVRDAIEAIKQMLVLEERLTQLAEDVARNARDVNQALGAVRREQAELRDRVARIEGAFAVLDRLQLGDRR